jgi:hypothetical protein
VRIPLPRGLAGQFAAGRAAAGLGGAKLNGVPVPAPEQPVNDTIAATSNTAKERVIAFPFNAAATLML